MTDHQLIAQTFIQTYPLPDDLRTALEDERQVKTSKGTYLLHASSRLPMITVLVDFSCASDTPLSITHYCSTAYILTQPANGKKPPHEILLWLPAVNLYGYYLPNRQQVFVYPQTTWSMIEQDLPDYLDRRKDAIDLCTYKSVPDYFDPVDKLLPRIATLLLKTETDRDLGTIADHMDLYNRALLTRPFCHGLFDLYKAAINIYQYLGSHGDDDEKMLCLIKAHILISRCEAYTIWQQDHKELPAIIAGDYLKPYLDEYMLFKRRDWPARIGGMLGWAGLIAFVVTVVRMFLNALGLF